MNTQQKSGWRFWAGWGLAFLGFPAGGLAGMALVGSTDNALDGLIGGAATGAVIGAAQWLALRSRLGLSPWWIVVTGAGVAAGLSLGIALFGIETAGNVLLWRGAVTGLAIGVAQTPLLGRRLPQAAVWLPTVALAWPIGWAVTRAVGVDLAPNFTVFGSTGAWAFQFLTGLALAWMVRQVGDRVTE